MIEFHAAGMLDVEIGRVVRDIVIRVTGDTISAWGIQGELPPSPPDCETLRFPDLFIIPGLINSHAHLCAASKGIPFHRPQSDESALTHAQNNMALELQSGVTTVRDCGDQNGVLLSLRRAASGNIHKAPRLLLCGPPLTMNGGHAHFLGGTADTAESVSAAVRKRIADGADFIKLIATGGGTPGTDPARASYDMETIRAAVETAGKSGIRVAAHCRGTPGIVNAVAAIVSHIEHACFENPDGTLKFDPSLADAMACAGVCVTPTIQLYRDIFDHLQQKSGSNGLNPSEADYFGKLPRVIEAKYQALRGFLAAGVTCVAGNDAGLPHTGFGVLHRELDAMVTAGMSPLQAVTSATLTAANASGLGDTIGSIRAGKQADLVFLTGDPARDIRFLQQVRLVVKAGVIVHENPDHRASSQ